MKERIGRNTARRITLLHQAASGFKKRGLLPYGFSFLFLVLIGVSVLLFQKAQEPKQHQLYISLCQSSICSDLTIPKESVLLIRPHLMAQIENKFKHPPEPGVQVVALTGPGGAGKTTLARYYARTQRASIAWEINAESRESLKSSYEELAKALAEEENDKKRLRAINEIQNPKEREAQILQLIKEKLRTYPNWILIYDNFGTFTEIKDAFPQDLETWGRGHVFITTRNANIRNNMHVDHVVLIDPLNDQEKYELFWNIIKKGGSEEEKKLIASPTRDVFQDGKEKDKSVDENVDEKMNEQIKGFLKEIPPFPLDVSVAAYYLRSTSTPYQQYFESSLKNTPQFVTLQEDILKEAGDYIKTRYGIIALSFQQVMTLNKDFGDLLFFISLIDSQNIPRNLLNAYKDADTVDRLVYHLKQYSLIINPTLDFMSLPHRSTLSFHRSTHAILLNYLQKVLDLPTKNSDSLMTPISNMLEQYMGKAIENEDFSQMDSMKAHLKAFLSHGADILNDVNKGAIEAVFGCAYYYTHYHETAKDLLTSSITKLRHHPSKENYQRLAQALSYLGNVHKDLGDHQKAKELLEEAIILYKQHAPFDHIGITRALTYLGDTYKNLGDHQKARDVLEQSIILVQQYPDSNQIGLARTMLHLGIVYRDLGDYEKALPLLKNSLALFEKYSPENYIERVRALKYLGNTYRSLGQYEDAKNLLEQSVSLSKKYLPENHISFGRSLVHLAIIYKKLGDYKKANELLIEALTIHERIFGKESVRTAWVIARLATIYQEMGEWEKARDIISECLKTYLKAYGSNSLRTSWVFIQLGYVYEDLKEYKKAQQILEDALELHRKHFNENHQKIGELLFHLGNIHTALGHYKKANELLQRALKIYEGHYGQNHIETALILGSLGNLYLHTGNLSEAEDTANKALTIMTHKPHASRFLLYELLAEIHLQRAANEENEGKTTEAKLFKAQALKELEQALSIIQPLFPEGSAHVIRIRGNLKNARGN
ncbi:MAG: tetratricopeptide repeat protein [Alphaproteobacteria bacterium]|nr:tetratricopeptide repeat protein [Alphaproteobacteria bacterium]